MDNFLFGALTAIWLLLVARFIIHRLHTQARSCYYCGKRAYSQLAGIGSWVCLKHLLRAHFTGEYESYKEIAREKSMVCFYCGRVPQYLYLKSGHWMCRRHLMMYGR